MRELKESYMGTKLPHLNSISVHHKNLQDLATEMYKISNMPATILNDLFASRATPYNLRKPVSFKM